MAYQLSAAKDCTEVVSINIAKTKLKKIQLPKLEKARVIVIRHNDALS